MKILENENRHSTLATVYDDDDINTDRRNMTMIIRATACRELASVYVNTKTFYRELSATPEEPFSEHSTVLNCKQWRVV